MSRRLAPALLWAALARSLWAQEPPSFGVKTEMVFLDVWVGRDGAPVEGLAAADFEVKDNGVLQEVEVAVASQAPVHAVLVLDSSASVAGARLAALKEAGRLFLEGLTPRDRATLLSFSHVSRLHGPAASEPALVSAALTGVSASGATALHDAVFTGLKLAGDRQHGRPVVVVFSDGEDRVSWLAADAVEAAARESEASVYVVDTTGGVEELRLGPAAGDAAMPPDPSTAGPRGPTNPWDVQTSTGRFTENRGPVARKRETRPFLRHVAEQTGGQVWSVGGPVAVADAFQGVLAQIRSRYVLRYEPRGLPREGWHKLEVRLRGKKGNVRARRGYTVAAEG